MLEIVKRRTMRQIIVLLLFWIILSEKLTLEVIGIGLFIIALIYILNKDNMFSKRKEVYNIYHKMYYLTIYIFTLLKEIVMANFHVAAIVLSPKMKISPTIVKFDTRLKKDFTKTVLANSITLTPGTLTVILQGDTFTIHCLEREYVDSVVNSKFEKILLKIEE